VINGAKNKIATAENLSDDDLEKLHAKYRKRADSTLASLQSRQSRRGRRK